MTEPTGPRKSLAQSVLSELLGMATSVGELKAAHRTQVERLTELQGQVHTLTLCLQTCSPNKRRTDMPATESTLVTLDRMANILSVVWQMAWHLIPWMSRAAAAWLVWEGHLTRFIQWLLHWFF